MALEKKEKRSIYVCMEGGEVVTPVSRISEMPELLPSVSVGGSWSQKSIATY